MTASEADRLEMYLDLKRVHGEKVGDIIMEFLPPASWNEFAQKFDLMATKDDIAALQIATKNDIAALRAETKNDIAALQTATKNDIAALQIATKNDIAALQIATKNDIAALQIATKEEFAALRGEIKELKSFVMWMGGIFSAAFIALFSLIAVKV